MSAISNTWSFIKRHKGKLMLASMGMGGFIYMNRVMSRFEKNWQTSASKDFVADVRKKDTHFENSIRQCNSTAEKLGPKILVILKELLNSDQVLEKVKANRKDLTQWNELSILILTRAASEVYCMCLFVCYVRVQLLVIAGYIYVDSCLINVPIPSTSKADAGTGVSMGVREEYMRLLHAFYDEGIKEIVAPVREAVTEVISKLSLKEEIGLKDLSTIFDEIKKRMAFSLKGPGASRFLIGAHKVNEKLASEPEYPLSIKDRQVLTTLMNETQDLLESSDFNKTLQATLDIGFEHLLDTLVPCFNPKEPVDNSIDATFVNPNSIKVPFVKLLPCMKSLLDTNDPDDDKALVRRLLYLDILNCYSANVYEAFCDISNRISPA